MAYESSGFNAATSAYYSRGTDFDHHVCIVGWDDAYPAGRFLRRPPGPGAFLIKNSWGTSLRAGRLLLDLLLRPLLGTTLAVFDGVEGAGNHDAIYQHDALGWSESIGFQSTTAWFAARYTSGGDGSVTAVSFYTRRAGRDLRGPRRAVARRHRGARPSPAPARSPSAATTPWR